MDEGTIIDPHHLTFLTHSQDIFSQKNAADRFISVPGPRKEKSGYTDKRKAFPNMTAPDTELFREALQYFIRQNTYQDPEKSTSDMIREALLHSREKKGASSAGQSIDLDELNKNLLVQALQICEGNKAKAAKLLGISRPTAVYRINKYGLHREILK
jgi:DNA-binding protein Fis